MIARLPLTAERLLRARPHVLAGALCLGLVAANVARPAPFTTAALSIAAGFAAAALDGRARTVALALALAVGGWWWASLRLDRLDRSILATRIGHVERTVAEVTGPVRRGQYSLRLPVRIRAFGRLTPGERALLELPLGRAPPQGAVIETVAEAREPRAAEAGFDERAWLRRQGIHVVLRGHSWTQIGRRGGVGAVADRLRAFVARGVAPGLEGERAAVIAGVVLGADEGLSRDLRNDFRSSGLYHLLAVSGQNVAVIAGAVLLLAWLVGLPRWLGELGVLGAIVAYVLAVGLQPSVVRAGIAGALASLAWLASRPRDRWYFLLVGAIALLAWNPYNVLDPGFQLSFSAVAAIFVLVPRLERRLEGYPVPRWLATVVAVSTACGIVTAPILWIDFGNIPVFSVLANAIAEPAVPLLLGLGLVCAIVHPIVPGVATALAWLNGWLAAYVGGCARLVGGLPHAQVSSAEAVVGLTAAVGLGWALMRLRPPRLLRAAVLLVMAGLLLVGWKLRPRDPPPPPPDAFRLTMLDVGQGDAVLVQVPEGAVLVDSGPPEAGVAGELRRLGVRRLVALVLTHPHRDHVGGGPEVLRKLRVGFVLDPLQPGPWWDERDALETARDRRVPVVAARVGETFRIGRLRLRILWPDAGGLAGDDPHRHGVVLLASYGQVDALLTGDSESDVTLPLRPIPVEILKVAHHGSSDPGLAALLRATHPRLALISVGKDNDYGHPTPSTLRTLDQAGGMSVYRTDEDGAVVVDSNGRQLWVKTEH